MIRTTFLLLILSNLLTSSTGVSFVDNENSDAVFWKIAHTVKDSPPNHIKLPSQEQQSQEYEKQDQQKPPPRAPELCMNNEHVAGRWINGTNTGKTYISCFWGDDQTHCGPRDNSQLYGSDQWPMRTGGAASGCDIRDDTRFRISQRERYVWKPLKCDLIPWNVTLFCELLGTRKILMVGDSTMHQTGAALASRITWDAAKLIPKYQSCAPQLAIGRINKLGSMDEVGGETYGLRALESLLNKVQPDILELNTGAHFQTFESYITDLELLYSLKDDVISAFTTARQSSTSSDNLTVLWKTMNPAHLDCSRTSNGPLNMEWNHQQTSSDSYNWWMQPKMDSAAKEIVTQLGWKLVDMTPLYYRQDAHPYGTHKDCLHYCLPGPPDLFSILLLNMLYNQEL